MLFLSEPFVLLLLLPPLLLSSSALSSLRLRLALRSLGMAGNPRPGAARSKFKLARVGMRAEVLKTRQAGHGSEDQAGGGASGGAGHACRADDNGKETRPERDEVSV
eukprot:767230-Hanusia_phi.AAC.8